MPENNAKVYRVQELTRRIKTLLEESFGPVWVEGELSNVRRPSSGHCYLTLKDESAQITAVLFRGDQRGLRFEPRDGMMVRVLGNLTVYERGGNYQLVIRKMEEGGGKGALLARFEELKARLQQEGLFDLSRKRPIPMLPQRIGVVTSPTGAAIRDILNILTRRFPNIHLLLAPARVQGPGAAEEIVKGIERLNRIEGLDVLIVGRGGGSLEDLWCFNEEVVARAIANSRVPVISAVGHEIDFTIADFVADLRAPTPSAAAELVVGQKDAFEKTLRDLWHRQNRAWRDRLGAATGRLQALRGSYVFREPGNVARLHGRRMETLGVRMRHLLEDRVRNGRQFVDEAGATLQHRMDVSRQSYAQELSRISAQLAALNPLAVLNRGYSLTQDAEGRIVRSVEELQVGQTIRTRLPDGWCESGIQEVRNVKVKHGKRAVPRANEGGEA